MGEKGNVAADNPLVALDALPLDALRNSPDTVNAWLDTYLKYREVHATTRAAEATEQVAGAVEAQADAASAKKADA